MTGAGAENGAIRFNTVTNQYEGYSENSSSWSSLGGVRDLDGNTTILAEETVGANDNTLWFFNDGVNTVKFTPEYQDFVNVKKIRSANVNAPAYEEFRANAPVSLGEYIKYRNNIYEVTQAFEPQELLVTNQRIPQEQKLTELQNLHSGDLLFPL